MVSVCTYCGVGCEIEGVVEGGELKRILPVKGGASSRGQLCVKGKYGFHFLKERLKGHLVKERYLKRVYPKLPKNLQRKVANLPRYDREFLSIPLETALQLGGWQLRKLIKEFGPAGIAGIGGARTNLESGWIFQKLIREVIGSPNIDNCARVCHAPSLKGLKRTIGEGASSLSFDDLFEAEVIFVIGSNTTVAHPIVASRIIEQKRRGAKLIVVDVREIELMKFADISVILPLETNLLFLNSLAREVVERGLYNRHFLEERVANFEEYRGQLLGEPDPRDPFQKGGFGEVVAQIREIAPLLKRRTAFLWGLGITEQIDGSDSVSAIANLAMLTGNFRRGAGVMPLRGQNNVQGVCDVGCLPYYLPDYRPPEVEGLKTPEVFEGILEGKIGGIINLGEELLQIHGHQRKVRKGLEKLPFLIVLEVMETPTARAGDLVFGVKSGYEKWGVYVNAERRLHLATPLVQSELPDDWEVLAGLARELGVEWGFKTTQQVLEEGVAREVTRFAGATYNRLNGERGLQWPIALDGTDTRTLHLTEFRTPDRLGHLYFVQWRPRGELVDRILEKGERESPRRKWYLTTGRDIAHYNNRAQTGCSPQLNRRYPEELLFANPIHRLELGEWVRLKSKYGESGVLRVKYTEKIRPYLLYTTFHYPESRINFLFGDEGDLETKTTRFKALVVEPIPVQEGS
ncbi:MAG: molybdopterin-dependent oxidoreductase [Campylobacterales bacterium]